VPDIEVQRSIVRAYNTIEGRIRAKRELNDNLIEQCRTHYAALIGEYTTDSDDLPDGWTISDIGEYADMKSGYAFSSEWWQSAGCKVVKIANVTNNSVDLDNCDCVSPENAKRATAFRVGSGDLLIAMTGATIGKIGLVPLTIEGAYVNQRVGKFFLGAAPIERVPYLFATLLYDRVARQLQPSGEYGSAQDNLSPNNIKRTKIVLPSEIVVENFNKQFESLITAIITNCAEISLLSKSGVVLLETMSTV
jgi:type I restriction enzyme S subunit